MRVGFVYGRRVLFGVVVVAATCSLFVAVARIEAATAPELSVSDASILEGDLGSRWLPFKLTLSAPATNAVTVGFTTVAGSATEALTTSGAGDYLKRSGTVTFSVGQVQKKVSVLVRGDVVPEPNETFGLQLTSVVGAAVRKGSGIGTILDAGSSSGFRIGIGDAAIVEGDTTNRNVVVPITLSAKAPASFAIGITTVNGTAVAGSDFVAVSKTVSVAAGQLLVAPVAVAIRPDLLVEGDRTFSISITSSVAIARSLGAVRIRDDDTAQAPASTTSASPTTAPPASCLGVSVSPGSNVQSVLNAYGTGTTFCFQPGTYVLSGFVVPKSYDRLISVVPRGAVFTGNDIYNAGVHGYGGSSGQHDVLFQGFVVTHFVNSLSSSPNAALSAGDNWDMENNEVSYNTQIGVGLNNGDVLNGSFVHHNGRYGFDGGPITNVLVSNNEVSSNNTGHYDINDAGGSKIVRSSYVTFRNNNVHDNYGNGLHADTDNIHITYESNNVHDNWGVGIFHENSQDAVIRYNTVTNNDLRIAGQSLYYGADIFLNDSKNTEIYGNTVKAGVHGIGLHDIARGSGTYGLYEIANDYVHDNTVTLPSGGQTGLLGDRTAAYTSTSGNRFANNSYDVLSTTASNWQWGAAKTWSQWRTLGNDTTGTVT